jgi:hypothetical protein
MRSTSVLCYKETAPASIRLSYLTTYVMFAALMILNSISRLAARPVVMASGVSSQSLTASVVILPMFHCPGMAVQLFPKSHQSRSCRGHSGTSLARCGSLSEAICLILLKTPVKSAICFDVDRLVINDMIYQTRDPAIPTINTAPPEQQPI